MAKKNPAKTPTSRVRGVLRTLFLRSRERATALKRENYTCEKCKTKRTTTNGVKLHVHHKKEIANWDRIMQNIYEDLLCDPAYLEVLCINCHTKEHDK